MRYLVVLAVLASVGLLGWGAHDFYCERSVAPAMLVVGVEEPERDLGEYPVGTSQIVFRVTNPTDHPTEVVSTQAGCGKGCCLKPAPTGRLAIPPGGSVDVACELMVIDPKEFEFSGDMFLNDNGLRVVKLTVRGRGVTPQANHQPEQ